MALYELRTYTPRQRAQAIANLREPQASWLFAGTELKAGCGVVAPTERMLAALSVSVADTLHTCQ